MINQRMVGDSFWRGPKGISIMAGGAALVLLGLAGGSSTDPPPVSPSVPPVVP
jgi:hypothetical protein